MALHIQKSSKITSTNHVWLVTTISELKSLNLSPEQHNYFKGQLKSQKMTFTNNSGVFTFIVKTDKLEDNQEKEGLRKIAATVFEIAKKECAELAIHGSSAESVELFAEGLSLASYQFEKYLSKDKKEKIKLTKVTTTNKDANLKKINTLVDATVWARDLVNEPLSFLTAKQLAEELKEKCSAVGIKVDVFGKSKILSLKMGGILAVNRGSIDPPSFTILEYKPENAVNSKPIVLVGKGIVFDTGGLSLKPTSNSMDFMKSDMGGAAAVAGATVAIAELKLPIHVITLIPATDNRPGVNAYVPGDIVTMFDGTTVEVLNTDAEGRMVLADALAYAKKFNPSLVIDAATLTGSAVAAIGLLGMVAMGNAPKSDFDLLEAAGLATHERIVQFPFWDDYAEEMKSNIADLKNIGGPYAGAITAGKFLEHFTNYPYIHLDLAGPTFLHKKDSYRGVGGTGVGVRLLTEFLIAKVIEWKKIK